MLKIELKSQSLESLQLELLVVPVFEDSISLPEALSFVQDDLNPSFSKIIEMSHFKGKMEETCHIFTENKNLPLLTLVGAGKINSWNVENARKVFGRAIKIAHSLEKESIGIYWDDGFPQPNISEVFFPEVIAATQTANFKIKEFQKEESEKKFKPVKSVQLIYPDASGNIKALIQEGIRLGEAVNFSRRLGEIPGNVLTPDRFLTEIEELQKEYGWELEILDRQRMEEEGLNALLAVASGSRNNPYLAIVKYKHPQAEETVAFVGKGVTFDSGGISIKPSKDMGKMKYDMSGAGAVLGALRVISEMEVPANVIAVMPLVENLPSGTATRPGDIVKSYAGYTIEVLNTDAEGRMILVDAISYVIKNYQPQILVDLATLTGAVVVALGHLAAGLISNNKTLVEEFEEAAIISGDRVWQLPLWDDYAELMKSSIADIANVSNAPGAGPITAAIFLKKFVNDTPWVHLDIAGTAFDAPEKSYQPKGATGFGVRLLYHWLKNVHLKQT